MNPLSHTTAVILAGGQGSRLKETLPDIPKALADINGKPFIRILLDRLEYYGIKRVVICTGYLGRMIRDALEDRHGAMRLIYSHETSPLGTAGALGNARRLLPAGPVLVLNGDSYCHTDLEKFYAWFNKNPASAAILLTHVMNTGRYGRVEIDAAGNIISFHEKTAPGEPGLINAGIYLITTNIIEAIPEQAACSLEKDIFPGLAGKGLAGFPTHDSFLDIGVKESYQDAPGFFATMGGQL